MLLIEYKKARLKFAVVESYQAGMELEGTEVKSLRAKTGSLDGSRVVIRAGEAYLVGATIPPYQVANAKKGYDPERSRRLLLRKSEILDLAKAEEKKGLTIVPLEVYTAGRNIKIRIAIVRGKGKEDKREDIKKRDALRESERVLKNR
jgi:SsrA-binding protein